MLEEEKLRKEIRSTKYEDVVQIIGFKEIMLRKTYANLYEFYFDDVQFISMDKFRI